MRRRKSPATKVKRAFNRAGLSRICEMPERDFAQAYDMDTYRIEHRETDNFFAYKDNGSNILAVAHLDTVGLAHQRACRFLDTEGGTVVYSRALDDRLGAYIILDLLPALGVTHDILLTVGEESGQSTAEFFDPPKGKRYDWMIEFDRGGTDVVMYQYDDKATRKLVQASGARVGDGIFSDIAYLEHLGIKGFNWGVGYRDYHGPRAHAYLDDTYMMVGNFLRFHQLYAGVSLPHVEKQPWFMSSRFDDAWLTEGAHDDDTAWDGEVVDAKDYDDLIAEYPTLVEIVRTLDAENG